MNMKTYPGLQAGLTLIELMISVTLGLMLITAVMGVFLSSNQNYKQDDNLSRMQENGRFIMRRIDEDIAMANYWGGVLNVVDLDISGVVFPILCGLNTSPAASASPFYVDTNPANFGGCITNHLPKTPIYVVKRALGTATTKQIVGEPYIIGDGHNARLRLYNASDPASIPVGTEEARSYIVRIYYIKDRNSNNVQIPTLFMRRLEVVGGAMQLNEYEIAEGVENLVVDFGIDNDAANKQDGIADYYINSPSTAELSNAISARIYVLVRSLVQDTGHKDNNTYVLGNAITAAGNGDPFRRRLFTKSVVMRNTAYLAALK